VRAAVVGGGPGGSLVARLLALDGARVTLFDASHPREKPCGGGLTPRALDLLPAEPPDDPLPARRVSTCRFESGIGDAVELRLERPVAVASRRELDAWLLRRAVAAGAVHVRERVFAVDADGEVRTVSGPQGPFDCVVGADGAGSLVRRTFLGPVPKERRMMAAGWYAPGAAPMVVRFATDLSGYVWLFPRPDHVGIGICAPLASAPTRRLLEHLERESRRAFPALARGDARYYAHTIPCPSAEARSVLEIAGEGWALVGDAGGLADPITGEGIYPAFRSAALLAETLREHGSPAAYPRRVLEDFGADLLKASSLRERFFSPGFSRRMVDFAFRSAAIREILVDLVIGEQGYLDLKGRLLRTAPRFVWQAARSFLAAA
jgi:flavin-dependent dehydrogenase